MVLEKMATGLKAAAEKTGEALAKTAEGAKTLTMEVVERGGKLSEGALTKPAQLNVLTKLTEGNRLAMERVGSLVQKDRVALANVRAELGLSVPQGAELLPSERQLQNLEKERAELLKEREVLIRLEMEEMLEENLSLVFEVFRRVPAEVLEIIVKTGKIPREYYSQRLVLFEEEELESEYVIMLARAFKAGCTTVSQIERTIPEFSSFRVRIDAPLLHRAEMRIMSTPEKELPNAEAKKLIEDKDASQLSFREPRQIAEESESTKRTQSAPASANAGGGGGSTPSAK